MMGRRQNSPVDTQSGDWAMNRDQWGAPEKVNPNFLCSKYCQKMLQVRRVCDVLKEGRDSNPPPADTYANKAKGPGFNCIEYFLILCVLYTVVSGASADLGKTAFPQSKLAHHLCGPAFQMQTNQKQPNSSSHIP